MKTAGVLSLPNECNLILLTYSGSIAYHLETSDSDEDYRGCFLHLGWDELLGIADNDIVIEKKKPDMVMYNLIKYIKLGLASNTTILETLYVPEDMIIFQNDFGELLRAGREYFISQRMFRSLGGYYACEHRRSLGEVTGLLGATRKEAINKIGYSYKNASHCIRLLDRGIRLLENGEYHVNYRDDDPMRELILNTKHGQLSKGLYIEAFDAMNAKFKSLEDKYSSNFPPTPKEEAIWTLVRDYIRQVIKPLL